MALITCRINKDANGTTEVSYTVHRLDPGDEVILTTDTANAALEWTGTSPFAPAVTAKRFMIPHSAASSAPLKITNSEPQVAKCGVVDSDGQFQSWPGGGFPIPKTEQTA